MRFDVLVEVRLRQGIADPEGATIERALPALGFTGIGQVRVGKAIRMVVEAARIQDAEQVASQVALRLLSNPVIEDVEVTVLGSAPTAGGQAAAGGGAIGQ